ncbi:YkgJ family cysteine cluster protein [Streptomyces sp. NPDC007983]|uniref:YkgJ family cysteine cluster protein n=1 Tax=Streptomyces sp. NPDC007983 TaxID=3364800 RepID=UPI0036ED8904
MNGGGANLAGCADCGGRCCREYNVHVTVADVRRLASGMAVHPREFVYLKEGKEEDNSDFRFRPGGPLYDLHLRHRPDTKGCVFLMEIAPGKARCGAYVHRPMVCATFPAALDQGSVGIRAKTLCGGPDSWNLATMDLVTYRRDIMRNRAAWREHLDLVERWNARIDGGELGLTHEDLYEFILATAPGEDTEAVSAETASP